MNSVKERIAKSIIQTLIDTYLGKEYVLVHRKSYVDLLESKSHRFSCGGKCKENG